MKRYHMIVEGRVQGVGFRSFCMQQALTYNLTGSVRNMENGMVEIFAQPLDPGRRYFRQGNCRRSQGNKIPLRLLL